MVYGVTGSTGALGSFVVDHLIQMGIDPASIVALARNDSKAEGLKALGVKVRLGDYDDPSSLIAAFNGVDRLLMISASEVGSRSPQHSNVIQAAKSNGVQQVVYTSLTQANVSQNPLATEHKKTEEELKASGMDWVFLRNNWYSENYIADIQYAGNSGIIATATGDAKVASASRRDYAEAAAKVLIGQGHSKKVYELNGKPWDYTELALVAAEILQRDVVYQPVTAQARKAGLLAAGMPESIASFVTMLDEAIATGAQAYATDDLETLLGREPISLLDCLKLAV